MTKLAVAIATEDAMPNAFVVWRGIEQSIEKAASYGYDGIELALKTADQVDSEKLESLLKKHNLCCPCISTGQVFAGLGLYFTTTNSAKRTEVIKVFKALIDLASRFGAMVNIGRSRGFIEQGEPPDAAAGRFIEVARQLADYAVPKGVTLILEPVNRYEINFINSVEQGASLMRQVNRPNMKLMPDIFHMNIEDISIGGQLERYANLIGYIHVADSNRLAPGQGHTDFNAFFASLKRMNYTGWLSVEILPKPDPDTAAKQAVEFLKPFLRAGNQ